MTYCENSSRTPARVGHPIPGVFTYAIQANQDERGWFAEIFRYQWEVPLAPVQWNLVKSNPGTLRGVHVHVRHTDYLLVASGRARIGLMDLRDGSPENGRTLLLDMDAEEFQAIVIPPGVAHGFYFPEPSLHIYSVSEYWKPEEEMGFHWADPGAGFVWGPESEPVVSPRDQMLGSVADLRKQLQPYQSLFAF